MNATASLKIKFIFVIRNDSKIHLFMKAGNYNFVYRIGVSNYIKVVHMYICIEITFKISMKFLHTH